MQGVSTLVFAFATHTGELRTLALEWDADSSSLFLLSLLAM